MFANSFGCHKNVECGLVCIIKRPNNERTQTGPIPLVSVTAFASVVHCVAQVEITQVYVNKEDKPIEAIYYFPVDSNGAVTHFHAELEGRTIKGVVKPQEEAKAQYEKAIKQQQTAFLGEENKADIFKVRIGFLKPGNQVKIVIGYVTEVKNEKGSNAIRFFLPTTVAPRYIPATETDAKGKDLTNMQFSDQSPAPMSIKVNLAIQGEIKSIESPTHKIKITENGPIAEKKDWNRSVVELNGKTTDMDRDFVLLVTPAETHVPRIYSEKLGPENNTVAVMTHFIPSFKLDEQNAELIFLLDRSGSMQGASIDLAKKALLMFLHSAPVDCYFNVVGFGSHVEFLFPESVKYDDKTLKKAVEHAKVLDANMGGTDILEPLKKIFKKPVIPGYLRQIFVLTDGAVSNTEQVIGLTKVNAHNNRVFSLGIGDGASHHLVEGIANSGKGTSAFVTYKETIDAKVLQQLKNAIQPSLTDITVTWDGVLGTESSAAAPIAINTEKTLLGYGKPVAGETPNILQAATYKQAPRKVPPIFDGSQMVLLGVFSKEVPTGVSITALSPDGPLTMKIPLSDNNDVGSTGMLHKLAAVKVVRELELEISGLGYSATETKAQEKALKKEIVEIAVQNGIASNYTSFIAVDEESKDKDESWVMQTRYVPSQLANGWHGGMSKNRLLRMNLCSSIESGFNNDCDSDSESSDSGSFELHDEGRQISLESLECWEDGEMNSRTNVITYTDDDDSVPVPKMKRSKRSARSTTFPYGAVAVPDSSSTAPQMMDVDDDMDLNNPAKEEEEETEIRDLHAFVSLQSFLGSFSLDSTFCYEISKELDALKTEATKNKWDEAAWATALALAYFSEKFSDQKDSWEMVYSKAKKWLTKNHSKDVDSLLAAAEKCIKSS